jgi:hypothetical protein
MHDELAERDASGHFSGHLSTRDASHPGPGCRFALGVSQVLQSRSATSPQGPIVEDSPVPTPGVQVISQLLLQHVGKLAESFKLFPSADRTHGQVVQPWSQRHSALEKVRPVVARVKYPTPTCIRPTAAAATHLTSDERLNRVDEAGQYSSRLWPRDSLSRRSLTPTL